MDLEHIIEMLMVDITAEGALGIVFSLLLLMGMFFGGGLLPLIEALANIV